MSYKYICDFCGKFKESNDMCVIRDFMCKHKHMTLDDVKCVIIDGKTYIPKLHNDGTWELIPNE